MLDYLHIRNVALIDEQLINFAEGFNIITGETGAGKSMIIDSINFALGEKVSKDFIRTGQQNALVEVLFFLKHEKTIEAIKQLGIEIDAYNSVLITREINKSGRTICKINGCCATMNMVKEVSSILIDIHGQHEHQSLLNPSQHITLLDQFCGTNLQVLKDQLRKEYKHYKDIQNDIMSLSGDERQRQQKIDILQYQTNEIEAAQLKPDEEEELLIQRKILSSSEKLVKGIMEVSGLINGEEDTKAAIDCISRSSQVLKDLTAIDPSLIELSKMLESIELQLEEVVHDVRNYSRNVEHNPQALYEIDARLDVIYGLKKKYGANIKEIIEYYEDIKTQLDFILNSEEKLQELTKQLNEQQAVILVLCQQISGIRKQEALLIQKQIEAILIELEMRSAKFSIQIENKADFSESGFDKVEFLISANAGEPLKPLARIASGGEMSRVMLAIKTVLADVDHIDTLIFDEIDTGISGRTAQKVAQKMKVISRNHQIIAITHLPQIAAMSDNHYLIEKLEKDGNTVTKVHDLTQEESVQELARLIGGVEITSATLLAANEMRQMAKK